MSPYLEVLKLRLVFMVLVSSALGFFIADGGIRPEKLGLLFFMLLGCLLAGAGTQVLNQVLEIEPDSKMLRTRNRPLPTGRMKPFSALIYGTLLVLTGVFLLFFQVNLLSAFLVLLTAFLYILVYTPLKQVTWLNTSVGAIPGAIPALVGFAANENSISLGGWILFFVLFCWQHPHFYAIAWIYKKDYQDGGFKMLSLFDPTGKKTGRQAVSFSILLILVSALLNVKGYAGGLYLLGAVCFGGLMLGKSIQMMKSTTETNARALLRASLIYFPALIILLILDSPSQ
jgi:heme o synthase